MSIEFAQEMREAAVGATVLETLPTGKTATYEKYEDGTWRVSSSTHPSYDLLKSLGINPADVVIPVEDFEEEKDGETLEFITPKVVAA